MTWTDRLQGFILCLLGLCIPVVVVASFFTDRRAFGGSLELIAYATFIFGCVCGLLNFQLSFLRPLLHHLRNDGTQLRHISGIPLIGNVTVLGLILAPPSLALSVAALVQVTFDTGGLQYFAKAIWREVVGRPFR